jgi:ribosomal protein S18 acetylase RimI-like enzyme
MLQAAITAWIAEAGFVGCCHPGDLAHRIYATPLAPRPVTVWEDGARVAGIEISGRFGTVFDVFTRPSLRGTDAERTMLHAACERGGTETDVFADDHTRIELLEELGFHDYRVWDHITERALSEPLLNAAPPPDGYAIRSPMSEDRTDLAAARRELFDELWIGPEIDGELVAVSPGGRVAGFLVVWLDHVNRVGLFEPIGVRPEFQRRGLGRALMTDGLQHMYQAGMRTAIVEHDVTNAAAAALYRNLGFEIRHETHGFKLSD